MPATILIEVLKRRKLKQAVVQRGLTHLLIMQA